MRKATNTIVAECSQNVVERNVLRYFRIVDYLLRVLGAIDRCVMPKCEQSLLVVVSWHAWLGQFRMKQFPQGLDVRAEHQLFGFRDHAVRH